MRNVEKRIADPERRIGVGDGLDEDLEARYAKIRTWRNPKFNEMYIALDKEYRRKYGRRVTLAEIIAATPDRRGCE